MSELKELLTVEEWGALWNESENKPVLLFKHSTRCPISAGAYQEFKAYLEKQSNPQVTYALVQVIESRAVSNQIAADLGVKHESPQVILMEHGKAEWINSHSQITQEQLALRIQHVF